MIARFSLPTVFAVVAAMAAEAPPAHRLFTEDAVHEIKLTFSQPDWWEQLTAYYKVNDTDAEYIEAGFQWGDVVFERIGVRFKGLSSYNVQGKKRPFRLKLNEYVKGQKIDGESSFSLSNFWNDPSFVREKMYYELAAAAGLAAPRANFAALYINGEYWGLYSLVEVVNDDFLDSRFPKNNKGSLYKGDPRGSLEDRGDGQQTYTTLYEKKTNEDKDWSDLMQLISVLNRTPPDQFAAAIAKVLDVDSVLAALALDNITVNLDNYIGMGHNYYLYFRPSDGRAHFIPWDPSLAFGALAQGLSVDGMKNLPLEWLRANVIPEGSPFQPGRGEGEPAMSGAKPLASKLWETPEYLARYREIVKSLNEKVVRPEEMISRMNSLRRMIAPWVELDPNKLVTLDQFERAMTEDQSVGGPGGGGNPPQLPNPQNPPPNPNPQNPPPGGGGGMGVIPGVNELVRAREVSVRTQLAGGDTR